MSQIGHNIKKLRKVKGLSQQAFAEIFGLTRGNISSYEEIRAEPKIDAVTNIANYFSIPLEDLLHKNLSVNEILRFNDYFEQKELKTTEFKAIPFIDRNHLAHISELHNHTETLPKIHFPIYGTQDFLALELDHSISHHSGFIYQENDIAFFKKMELDLLHTIENEFGLFFSENQFFIGKFIRQDSGIILQLNEWLSEELNVNDLTNFWKYYGRFEKNL